MVAKYQEELDPDDIVIQNSSEPESPANSRALVKDYIAKRNQLVQKMSQDNELEDSTPTDEVLEPENPVEAHDRAENIEEVDLLKPDQVERPQLNCDDIDALENLYISKPNAQQNGANLSVSALYDDPSSETSSVQSATTTGTKKKKKKAATKVITTAPVNGDDEHPKAKSRKSTTGTGKKSGKKTKKQAEANDEEARERRQLEDFLGGPIVIENVPGTERAQEAYESL